MLVFKGKTISILRIYIYLEYWEFYVLAAVQSGDLKKKIKNQHFYAND